MRIRAALALAALSLVPALVLAASPAAPPALAKDDLKAAARIRDTALRGTGAHALLASITTEVGPRLAGSPGDRAAVAWAQRKLAELGLENVRTQEVMVPQWVRGEIEARVLSPYPQVLAATALGGSIGTPDGGVEGEVVRFPDLAALKQATRQQVEGRIVFVDYRMDRSREGKGYGAGVPIRLDGASTAGALGATAIVIRSMSTSQNRLPHSGAVVYTVTTPRIPAAAISNPDADLLGRMVAGGQPVRMRLKLSARDLPYQKSANVIGELPGSEHPEQVVVLSAHLDSWDLGQGAIDDGAGVAIVSEAVALIKRLGLKPKRTLRVVLFANEEFGLSGGNVYGKLSPEELANHVVAMEADFGGAPVFRLSSRVAPERLPVVAEIAKALAPLGIEAGNNEAMGGADIAPLRRQGVPVLGLSQDGTQYFDVHHTANDTLDKVDPKSLDQAVGAYAVAAWLAAQADGGFGRIQ